MNDKNYAEVLIDGKIYTLGGAEDQEYFQKVAGYITGKMNELKKQDRFSRQSQEYQAVMVALNIADDYFKTMAKLEESNRRCESMEKDTYGLKHELVTTQMSLERTERELEKAQAELKNRQGSAAEEKRLLSELEAANRKLEEMKKQDQANREELLKLRALQATAAQNPRNNGQYGGQHYNSNNNRR